MAVKERVIVLIALDRDVPGVLMQGVHCDIHWRVMQDVDNWQSIEANIEYMVYIQAFVPRLAVGLGEVDGRLIPARHNSDVVSDVTVVWSPDADYRMQQHRLQWVEVYYGRLWMSSLGNVIAATMDAAWYPRKRKDNQVQVLPKTFMKYMLPAAQYLCGFMAFFNTGDDAVPQT